MKTCQLSLMQTVFPHHNSKPIMVFSRYQPIIKTVVFPHQNSILKQYSLIINQYQNRIPYHNSTLVEYCLIITQHLYSMSSFYIKINTAFLYITGETLHMSQPQKLPLYGFSPPRNHLEFEFTPRDSLCQHLIPHG